MRSPHNTSRPCAPSSSSHSVGGTGEDQAEDQMPRRLLGGPRTVMEAGGLRWTVVKRVGVVLM